MKILIKNGRLIDPVNDMDMVTDLLVEDGKVAMIDQNISISSSDIDIIDATGQLIVPGLIDMHVHLREPGYEYKETIKSGTMAAAAGGFTTVCCMPNTKPVNDSQSVTEFILHKAATEGVVNVLPIGAITKAAKGEEITEMAELKEAGCIAFSDDGRPVMNSSVMRRSLEYAKMFGLPLISHCEDLALSEDGVVNEGRVSTELGLKGIPNASEDIITARDIALSGLTGGRVHIAHVSTKGSVDLIRIAKQKGLNVTAETCPHYLVLTDEAVTGYNTNAKMKPPLRSQEDVEAVRSGLKDGTIDVIATDHAPHAQEEKEMEFDYAPFGITGLETALSIIMRLVEEGLLTLTEMVMRMSSKPAMILGIDKGNLKVGAIADITIINPHSTWVVESLNLKSKGKNTPFEGWKLKGQVSTTIVSGRVVYR